MSKHMVIAPGEFIDRSWFERTYAVNFMVPREQIFTAEMPPLAPMPPTYHATLRRYVHPAWKVRLAFYVDDRIFPLIPHGYVMPGWVQGVPLEQSPLWQWAHNADRHQWELRIQGQESAPYRAVTCEYLANWPVRSWPDMPPCPTSCPPRPDVPMRAWTLGELADLLARGTDDDQAS